MVHSLKDYSEWTGIRKKGDTGGSTCDGKGMKVGVRKPGYFCPSIRARWILGPPTSIPCFSQVKFFKQAGA